MRAATDRWWKRVVSSPYRRRIGLLAGANGGAQVIALASAPILTRLFTPVDFGVLAVYSNILLLLVAASTLRYDFAALVEPDEQRAIPLLGASAIAVFCTAALVGLTSALAARIIANHLGIQEHWRYLYFLAPGVLAGGLYSLASHWALRDAGARGAAAIGRSRIEQALATLGAQVSLAWLFPGPAGLVAGSLLGISTGTARLARRTRLLRAFSLELSIPQILLAARRAWRFPVFSAPSVLLYRGSTHVPALLIAGYYDAGAAGTFLLAQKVLGTPVQTLAGSVAQAFASEARARVSSPQSVRLLVLRTSLSLLAAGFIPLSLVALLAPRFAGTVFGDAWSIVGSYVQLLTLEYLSRLALAPVSQVLTIVGRLKMQFALESVRVALIIGAFTASSIASLSPLAAVGIYSASSAAWSWIALAATLKVLRIAVPSPREGSW